MLKNKKLKTDHITTNMRLIRIFWNIVYVFLFKTSPVVLFGWRNLLLRVFNAKLGRGVHVYPNTRIWAPWNLKMEDDSCLGPEVDCYNVALITLGVKAVVSQRAYLCTASHDIRSPRFELISAPIAIGVNAWVAAEAFIGPGVTIHEGAVVGANACVIKDVQSWTIMVGNPAKVTGRRKITKGE